MVGLSSALSSALSGLLATSNQSAVVSRNVTRAGDQDYTRRDVALKTDGVGGVRSASYTRSADKTLQDRVLNSNSRTGGTQVTADALKVLSSIIGDPQDNTSVAAGLYQLQQSLRDFKNNPSSNTYATGATSAARMLVSRLNSSTDEIAAVRNEANVGVNASVEKISSLLLDLQPIDQSITTGTPGSEAYLDNLDERDGILRQLSQEIGLRIVNKSDGGIALYSDSGITLFDVVPRRIEVRAEGPLAAGEPGPQVYIDGVEVSGSNPVLPLQAGALTAHLRLRDETTITYQAQLDEIARSLVSIFAEQDQNATSTLPPATGIFSYDGSPAVGPAATHISGLAGTIKLNVAFDDRNGGNPMLLRDGGSNGTVYVYNAAGVSGFQQRLSDLADAFDKPFSFDIAAKLSGQATIKAFAEFSASQLESERAKASGNSDEAQSANQRWSDALASKTGVNIDEEMASLLSLEKSYQASAKVITTIDKMFSVLIDIVR